jgi:uncharacterized coiled-coil DUF342 family protein
LRQQKQLVPDEIVQLRVTVDEFRKETDKLKNDLDDIKKRLDAKEKPAEKKDKDETADSNKKTPPDKAGEKQS